MVLGIVLSIFPMPAMAVMQDQPAARPDTQPVYQDPGYNLPAYDQSQTGVQPGDAASRGTGERRAFNYVLRVSPRLTYTDNVDLAPDGEEQADGLASVYFSGGALVDRVGFSGIVNGTLQVGSFIDPPEIDGEAVYDRAVISQNIVAGGTARLVDNLLFLDVAASAREQALDETTRTAGTSLAGNQRQADAYSVSISPYLYRRMPNDSSLEARYRYISVLVDDDQSVDGIDDFLNDSQAHELLAEYASGQLFDRIGFAVQAYANRTEETGSEVLPEIDYTQASVSGDLSYAMNRRVALVGTLGYDEIETDGDSPFDDDDLSGAFWKAGLALTPGRKTEARLELGERYGGTWVDAAASYKYSSRLQFRLAAERRFLTTAQAQAGRFNVLQSETLSYAEELRQLQSLTAADILDRVLEFNTGLGDLNRQQAGLSRTDSAYFDIVAQAPRTSFVLRAGGERSDFGFEAIDTWTLAALVDHRLSRRLNAYLRGNYQKSLSELEGGLDACLAALAQDPQTAGLGEAEILALCQSGEGLGEDTDTVTLTAGLDYLLFRDISGFAELSRSQRFSDNAGNEYEENAATVGVSFDF